MNSAALYLKRALEELVADFEKDPGDYSSGPYWNEQDLVCDLASRVKKGLKEKLPNGEIRLDVSLRDEDWPIMRSARGREWIKRWRRKRIVDLIILEDEKKDGEEPKWPISVVAEVKFSYRKPTNKRKWIKQVEDEIGKDAQRLRDLKEMGLCREAFFFHLDEYNIGENRKRMEKFIREKCGQLVRFYHEGKALHSSRPARPSA